MNIRLFGLSIIYLHANRIEAKVCLVCCPLHACHVLGLNTLLIKLNAGLHAYTYSSDNIRLLLPRKGKLKRNFCLPSLTL
jgi:hypothetical protein